jgi:hypothetical protein
VLPLRTHWLTFLGVALVAALGVRCGTGDTTERVSQQAHVGAKAREAKQWEQLANKGQREVQSSLLGPWPFSEVKQVERGMPDSLRKKALELLGEPAPLELRFADARYATTSHQLSLWVVPGNGVICIFESAKMASACTTTVQAYHHGVVLQTYTLGKGSGGRPVEFTSLGVVPNGVTRVPVKVGNRWTAVDVVNNTFFIRSRQPIGVPPGLQRPPR